MGSEIKSAWAALDGAFLAGEASARGLSAPALPQRASADARALSDAAASSWRMLCERGALGDIEDWLALGWGPWAQAGGEKLASSWALLAPPQASPPWEILLRHGEALFDFPVDFGESEDFWNQAEFCPLARSMGLRDAASVALLCDALREQAPSLEVRDLTLGRAFSQGWEQWGDHEGWAKELIDSDPALWAGSRGGALTFALSRDWRAQALAMAQADPSRALASLGLGSGRGRGLWRLLRMAADPLFTLDLALNLGAAVGAGEATQALAAACQCPGEKGKLAAAKLLSMGADPLAVCFHGSSGVSEALQRWSWSEAREVFGIDASDLARASSLRGEAPEPALLAALRKASTRAARERAGFRDDDRLAELWEQALSSGVAIEADVLRKALGVAAVGGLSRCCEALAKEMWRLGEPARSRDLLEMAKEGEANPEIEAARIACVQAASRWGMGIDEPVDDPRSAFHGRTLLFAALWRAGQSGKSKPLEALQSFRRAKALAFLGAQADCPWGGAPVWEDPQGWRMLGEMGRLGTMALRALGESQALLSEAKSPQVPARRQGL